MDYITLTLLGSILGLFLGKRIRSENDAMKAWDEGFQLGRASGLEDGRKYHFRAMFEVAELERMAQR